MHARTPWSNFASMFREPDGPRKVSRILSRLPLADRQEALAGIAEAMPGLADEIRELMFVFEDLPSIPDNDFRVLIREVDTPTLVLALKGADRAMTAKVEKNISRRQGDMLRGDLQSLGPVRVVDVEAARKKIMDLARALEKDGRIRLLSDPSDVWID